MRRDRGRRPPIPPKESPGARLRRRRPRWAKTNCALWRIRDAAAATASSKVAGASSIRAWPGVLSPAASIVYSFCRSRARMPAQAAYGSASVAPTVETGLAGLSIHPSVIVLCRFLIYRSGAEAAAIHAAYSKTHMHYGRLDRSLHCVLNASEATPALFPRGQWESPRFGWSKGWLKAHATMSCPPRLLLIAVSARALAMAARRARYAAIAIDAFGDEDTRAACVEAWKVEGAMGGFAGIALEPIVAELCAAYAPQGIVFGPGFDDCPRALVALARHARYSDAPRRFGVRKTHASSPTHAANWGSPIPKFARSSPRRRLNGSSNGAAAPAACMSPPRRRGAPSVPGSIGSARSWAHDLAPVRA